MSLEDKKRYKNALIAAATPEILEISQVNPFLENARQEVEEEDQIYKEKLEAYQKERKEEEEQAIKLEKSRTEDRMFALYGSTRVPRFAEVYFSKSVCPYGCGQEVAFIANRSPNVSEDHFDRSVPLETHSTDQYGNFYLRHNCILDIKKNVELQYIIKRLENTENIVKDLRNQLDRHKGLSS